MIRRATRRETYDEGFGLEGGGVVYADSFAALSIAKANGAGRHRHINTSGRLFQENQNLQELELRKVRGTETPAGLMN